MHKFTFSILIVLQSCTNVQNLEQVTNVDRNQASELTTTLALGTTTTLQVSCVQESNKDRELITTKDLQEFLKDYEFYTAKVDGKFGPQTETALRNFQKKVGIVVDGKFGKETKKKMKAWTGCES